VAVPLRVKETVRALVVGPVRVTRNVPARRGLSVAKGWGAVRVTLGDIRLKLAVTVRGPFIVTWQLPVPVQAPLQPVKVDPPLAVAVRVTGVPPGYAWEQSLPHAIPAGLEVTVPKPVPAFPTIKVQSGVVHLKIPPPSVPA
jgi:hypothetical protein